MLLKGPSNRLLYWMYSSHSIFTLVVCLCAPWKFGALSPGINKIRAGENGFPKVSTPRFSIPLIDCLTYHLSFLEYQGPSWTTVFISPLTCMQANLKKSSDLKFTIKIENFIELWSSLNLLLSKPFTVVVAMILTNIQQWSGSCSCHRDQNVFWNFCLSIRSCIPWQNHVFRKIYIWDCACHELTTHSQSTLLIIQSTLIEMKCV